MQNDYWVMIDNHFMLLVEPFLRYTDKGHINKIAEDLTQYTHKVSLKIEKYLEPYTEQQKLNWKNSKKIVVYENEAQLSSFIEGAKERKNAGKKLYSDIIRKIYKDHGNEESESLRGQRAVKDEDFFRIPEVISEPEVIESAGMYNKNPVIHFKKSGITIVGIIADGSLDLYTQTMYISKKIEALQQR